MSTKVLSHSKLQRKIKWEPHKGQKKAIDLYLKKDDLRIACGRRWGKSELGAYIALSELIQDDKRIWIVGPNYTVTDKIFEKVEKWMKKYFPSLIKSVVHSPTKRIETHAESFIECKSTNSDSSLIGDQLDLVIVDEVARVDKKVYERDIEPCLIDRQGKSMFVSTPFGKNWFYDEFNKAKQREYAASINEPSYNNPYLPTEYFDRLREKLPKEVFKQEIEAKFADDASTLFKGLEDLIEDKSDCYEDPKTGHAYVMGVDFAKSRDYTVITIIDRYTHKVVYWERSNKDRYHLQKQRITKIAKRYNNAIIIFDGTGKGDPIVEDLEQENLHVKNFIFSGKSKTKLIDKLIVFVEQKLITIPNETELINELKAYRREYFNKKTGKAKKNPTYTTISGMHDDCVDSLALAVWGLPDHKREVKRNKTTKSNYKRSFQYNS